MRCQYCGKRLPILRKLTDGEFCSPAHRRSFQEEQERQALSRLLEASQMGASRRASENRAETPLVPGKEVVSAGARKGGASIPQPCQQFFPLTPERRLPALASDGPHTIPSEHVLQLTDELARRTPLRMQRRLGSAGPSRHYGPSPAARPSHAAGLLDGPTPLRGAPSHPPIRRQPAPAQTNPQLRTAGQRPLRLAVPPSSPGSTSLKALPAGRVQMQYLPGHAPRLRIGTDWSPPRPITATRMADAVALRLANRDAALPLRVAAAPLAREPWPLAHLAAPHRPLPVRVPAPAGRLPLSGLELRHRADTALAEAGLAQPVPQPAQPAQHYWHPSIASEPQVPLATRLLRYSLRSGSEHVGETVPSLRPVQAIATARQLAPNTPRLATNGRPAITLRGSWLMALSAPDPTAPAPPTRLDAQPTRLSSRPPVPPARHLAAATPSELERMLGLPSRYRPEPRVMADRGRLLFLAVMTKPLALGTPLAPPKRKKMAAREVKATGSTLRPFAATGVPPRDIATVAQRPPALLPWDLQEIEMAPVAVSVLGAMPRPNRRMVRWLPTLPLCVEGAGLASFEQPWKALNLRPLPPRTAFHPDPARTQRRSLVPDVLRQMPFSFKPSARVGRAWSLAPADLRWVAMVVPVVLGLAWWTLAPKSRRSDAEVPVPEVTETAEAPTPPPGRRARPAPKTSPLAAPLAGKAAPTPPASGAEAPVKAESFFDTYLGSLEAKIRARAAVEVSDDFRSGLSAWEGDRGWSDGWSYDQAGFVLPASLALLRPTTGLTDYTFEFLGMIEQKALSWVFRAKDTRNYYAGKLVVVQSGPLPVVAFVRYRVVNGREEGRKVITLPQQVRSETLYRVKIDVNGNDFTTSVLGKIVDTFTDTVHPQGGVGLFSARGEQAKIRWVEVSHQYDSIGRLCAFLAPPRLEPQPSEQPIAGRKSAPKKRGS